MMDLGDDRFNLDANNGFFEGHRSDYLIRQIKFSQGRACSLLMQFRKVSERNSLDDEAEKCRLADEFRKEVKYLLGLIEVYEKINEKFRDKIEGSIYGSYCTMKDNMKALSRATAELAEQPFS